MDYVPVDHPQSFSSYPLLYLELIENKEKVIPSLKNKTHDPIFLPNAGQVGNVHAYQPMDEKKEFFDEKEIRSRLNNRMKKPEHGSKKSNLEPDMKSVRERTLERQRDEDRVRELSKAREKERERERDREGARTSRKDERMPSLQESDPLHPPSAPYKSQNEILDVLGPSTSMDQPHGSSGSSASYVPTVSYNATQASSANGNLPPSLSEINQGNGPVKNLTYSNVTDEMKRKRELMFRFDILKKSYKDATIPDFNEYTDLVTMENVYEDTVRKVGLDSKVEGYKKFLTMGFFGIEFVFTNLLKVDMKGFAKQQLSSMNSYDRILIELGEKAMLEKSKSQWPAEIRLLFTIVMNAVIFLLMKSVMSGGITSLMGGLMGGGGGESSGAAAPNMMSGIMDMMSGLAGGGSNSSSASSAAVPPPPKPKQKMKGPSINLDDMDKAK